LQPRRYVAFLRAINVGGHLVKMSALKSIFESMKFGEVETFIASGNVIFTSEAAAPKLEAQIEKALEKSLGYAVTTFLRTVDEISVVAERNPFGKTIPPGGRLFVGFVRNNPAAAVKRKVEALSTTSDAFTIQGRELYWLCTVPSFQSITSGYSLEKVIGQQATIRNVNTIRRLAAKYQRNAP
jgi:uncharacterized protein (DUF1697 family)